MRFAGLWIRVWALLIDTALFGVPTLALMYKAFAADTIARARLIGVLDER